MHRKTKSKTRTTTATLCSALLTLTMIVGCTTTANITSTKGGEVYARASYPGDIATLQHFGRIEAGERRTIAIPHNGPDKWVLVVANDGTYAAHRGSVAKIFFDDNWWREQYPHMQEILEGSIVTGMTTDEVYFSWGIPEHQSVHTGTQNTYEQWTYETIEPGSDGVWQQGARVLGFHNGTLSNIDSYIP